MLTLAKNKVGQELWELTVPEEFDLYVLAKTLCSFEHKPT